MTTLPEGEVTPEAGTKEAEKYLWSMKGTCLELTHNYGSEDDPSFQVKTFPPPPFLHPQNAHL